MQGQIDFVENYRFIKDESLSYTDVPKGIIFPHSMPDGNQNMRGIGGVYDKDFNIITNAQTLHSIDGNINVVCGGEAPPPCSKSIDFIDEEVVWLGYAWDFWGHFLSDSISRLWFLLNKKNLKCCYISGDETFLEIFELFGLSHDNLLRISKPTMFRNVIVPDISFCYYDYCSIEYKQTIERIRKTINSEGIEKVYLSRSNYGGTFGENLLEEIFEKEGFKIFYPELLRVKEKISILKGAKVVAGTSGTGMHNILFSEDGIKSINFNRSNTILKMQCAIDEIKNLDSIYVDVYQNILPVASSAQPYLIGITPQLLEFFNDYGINFRYKNGRFRNTYYNKFVKDILYFMDLWAKVNVKENSTLPEAVSRKDIAECINSIFEMYELYMLTKSKKTIKDKIMSLLK